MVPWIFLRNVRLVPRLLPTIVYIYPPLQVHMHRNTEYLPLHVHNNTSLSWIGPGDRKQIAAVAGPSDIRIVERHSGRGMACGLSSGEKGGTLTINVNWCLIIIRRDNEVNISLAKIKTCFA